MAGIIKSGQPAGAAGSMAQPTTFQFGDITLQAAAMVAAARQQAQELIAAAEREAQSIRKRAEREGLEAAAAQADQKMKQQVELQLRTVLPALKTAAESLVAARQTWVQDWERGAVTLACKISEKIVRRQLALDPQIPLDLVRESLELAAGQRHVRIQLHPDDYAQIAIHVKQLAEQWNRLCVTDIEPHADVSQGSCRLCTEQGEIDQRFEVQLARIEQELIR
jgi:flagellar biosynthesis/type III secretory pathway protein FliH